MESPYYALNKCTDTIDIEKPVRLFRSCACPIERLYVPQYNGPRTLDKLIPLLDIFKQDERLTEINGGSKDGQRKYGWQSTHMYAIG
jgi:hypothetical protein